MWIPLLFVLLAVDHGRARVVRSKRQMINLPLLPDNQPYKPIALPGGQPGGFSPFQVPLGYQEPNPLLFQHVIGLGQKLDLQQRFMFDGELDFPIIEDGYYWPGKVKGNMDVGPVQPSFDYGHVVNPVNPFEIGIGEIYYCVFFPDRCNDPAAELTNYSTTDPRDDFEENGEDSDRVIFINPDGTTTNGRNPVISESELEAFLRPIPKPKP